MQFISSEPPDDIVVPIIKVVRIVKLGLDWLQIHHRLGLTLEEDRSLVDICRQNVPTYVPLSFPHDGEGEESRFFGEKWSRNPAILRYVSER
jgi:hypothetical protein